MQLILQKYICIHRNIIKYTLDLMCYLEPLSEVQSQIINHMRNVKVYILNIWYSSMPTWFLQANTHKVKHFYPQLQLCVQPYLHATSYLISTNNKNTSLSSSILHASQLVYVRIYTHCQVKVMYFPHLFTLHTNCHIHHIKRLTNLYFDGNSYVAGFRKWILSVAPF